MNDEIINNVSPLRYPGGKTRACFKLYSILQKYYDLSNFDTIISPFFGGGSFEFYMQNNHKLNIIANDKFVPLFNFWSSCKYDKENLCNKLYKEVDKITKDKFNDLRKSIINEKNILEQSVSFFIINRCSFSGATLSGGYSRESSKKRFTNSSIDRINKLDLSKFCIYNTEFEEFLEKSIPEKSFIFVDPPYYLGEKSKLYGNNGDMHENFDHVKLFKYICSKKNWMITYNNCEYIKNLYKDHTIIETNWSYGMNNSKKSSEIVIIK